MTTGKSETFSVEPRKKGKHHNRSNRRVNKIPAVIYGPKTENQNVLINELFIDKHRSQKYESAIFKTESSDGKLSGINVMLKNIDYHPVSNRPIHVDLYALDMTQKIRVHIPVKYIGEPIGVKEEGGVRQIILHEIEIECSPLDIPEQIEVNIEGVKLNHSLHVSDMVFPANVKVMTAMDRTAMTVTMPKEEKEETPAEGEATAEGAVAEGAAAPAGEKKAEVKK